MRESLERATTMGMIPEEMDFPFAELLICMGKLYMFSKLHLNFGDILFRISVDFIDRVSCT